MFKNLILYRINGDVPTGAAKLEAAMEPAVFTPCGPTQPRAAGWVPPRSIANGTLVEAIDGQWIITLMIEQRILPAAVVARRVDELAAAVEKNTGRKPGKKHRRELKDEATHELLPKAFTKRSKVTAWIDPKARLLAVDTGSQAGADLVAAALILCAPKMNLHLLQTKVAPHTALGDWLHGNEPDDFTVAREGELKADDESKAVVRYQNHDLDSDEVRGHLDSGKTVTKLALLFGDTVGFVLTDSMAIKKLTLLGAVMESGRTEGDDAFSANVAIATGELRRMLPALIEALGGLVVLPLEAAVADAEAGADPLDAFGPAPGSAAPAEHSGEVDTDPMYEPACNVVRTNGRASISLVQRHLRLGYNRAARLIERMQADGLVSAMSTDGSRTILAGNDVGAHA